MLYHKVSMNGLLRAQGRQQGSKTQASRDQAGMASILITMITMIVITLIVLGFATISRREQSNTLDQQLSTQAFYAAETAVNDTRQIIENGGGSVSKPDCTKPVGTYPAAPVWLNPPTDSVGYTCLIVNPAPSNLEHDSVGDNSWVVPVTSADGTTAISSIQIQWQPTSPPTSPPAPAPPRTPAVDCPTTLNFSPATPTDWKCGYGLLRMDLVPTAGSLSESTLASSLLTGFFEPKNPAGPGTLAYANKGRANVVAANCATGSYSSCTAIITGLGTTSYTLRLNSLYRTSDITVTAYGCDIAATSCNSIPVNGQVMVDATGVASGVLRRIQVRIPANNYNGNIPGFAIQSDSSVCKRFSVTPGYFNIASDLPAAPAMPDTNSPVNPMCMHANSGSPQPGG